MPVQLLFRLFGVRLSWMKSEDYNLDDVEDVDESYDFDAVQAENADGLDYNYEVFEGQEITNQRGHPPLRLEKEPEEVEEKDLVLDHHALFVRHEDRQILVIDYVLPEVPQWLEYQGEVGHFTIVMSDAEVAHIDLQVDADYLSDLEQESRILLVTNGDNEKIVHHLLFMIK